MPFDIEQITSLQNPKIKDIVALRAHSELRRERGVFIVEGQRELSRCIEGGYRLSSVFFCESIITEDEMSGMFSNISLFTFKEDFKMFRVSDKVYEKIAYRDTTEGLLAIVESGSPKVLDELVLSDNPLVVVLESVEKPGNLGAVLRTTDACRADAVIVCDPLTDIFNPNLIRASLGGVFVQNVVACTSEEAIKWLKEKQFRIFTAQLQDSVDYYDSDMTGATALVFGTEADGLSDIWREASDCKIKIPMLGHIDSLNVSVSAAILCYEALRQRQKKQVTAE